MPESKISKKQLQKYEKLQRRKLFSNFVEKLLVQLDKELAWRCCGELFTSKSAVHIHVAKVHFEALRESARVLLKQEQTEAASAAQKNEDEFAVGDGELELSYECVCSKSNFVVILFYHYVMIELEELKQIKKSQVISSHYTALHRF